MKKSAFELLEPGWYSIDECPDYTSFRCLIKFEEFGLGGPTNPHVSTGYWWHLDKRFTVDDKECKKFTPYQFIPIYEGALWDGETVEQTVKEDQ